MRPATDCPVRPVRPRTSSRPIAPAAYSRSSASCSAVQARRTAGASLRAQLPAKPRAFACRRIATRVRFGSAAAISAQPTRP